MGVRPSTLAAILAQSSAPAGMPAGAVGLWYMDQHTSTPRARIPNAAAAGGSAPTNLLIGSRRLFSNNYGLNLWTPPASFTDSGLAAPDGTTDASVLNGTGNFTAGLNGSITLPAGTYTLAIRARRNTGTDQQFRMQFSTAPVLTSAIMTATDAWQWFTFSGVRAAGAHVLRHCISFDAATGCNIQTLDWMLLPGTVTDPAELDAAALASLRGDMYLHAGAAYTGGYVDLAASGRAMVAQFPTPRTLTTFTAMALVSKTVAGSAFQTFLGNAASMANFRAMTEESGASHAYFAGQNLGSTTSRAVTLLNQGYQLFTVRYDDAQLTYWLNDNLLDSKTVAAGDHVFRDLVSGLTGASSLWSGIRMAGALALYARALTDAEIRQAYAAQVLRAAASSITATRARVVYACGDSLTAPLNGYVELYRQAANPVSQVRNRAVSGATLDLVINQINAILAGMPSSGCSHVIVTLLVGANLPSGDSITTFLQSYAAQCDRIRATGAKVAIGTITPRISGGDTFNARRAIINTELRLWTTGGSTAPGIHVDAIYDLAADPDIGPDSAANGESTFDPTWYYDGVHFTAAAHARVDTIYRPVVNAL